MPPVSDRTRIVSQEAAYWYIRCSDERAMLYADRQLFSTWLRRSPENIAEILRISKMDGEFEGQRLIDRFSNLDDFNVYDIHNGTLAAPYEYNPSDSVSDERIVKSKTHPIWALAAMLAAISVLLFFGFTMFDSAPGDEVRTAASEWHQMRLKDDSVVHMDARTRLKVEYGDKQRVVHLHEGQAVFEVAKDAERPFTVSTRIVDVTAVGTRFSVAIEPGVTTTVSEGAVRVTSPGKLDDPAAVDLHAGEQLRVLEADGGGAFRLFGWLGTPVDLSKVDPIQVDAVRKLEWPTGFLRFEGETIEEAVIEYNRRNILQIEIDDRSIAKRVLGFYRLPVDAPESFAQLLDSLPGVVVIKEGSKLRLKAE